MKGHDFTLDHPYASLLLAVFGLLLVFLLFTTSDNAERVTRIEEHLDLPPINCEHCEHHG